MIGCLLLFGLGAFVFWNQKNSGAPDSSAEFLQFTPGKPSPPLAIRQESLESVKNCVKSLEPKDLEQELYSRLQDPEPKIVWKIWHVKAEGEKQYRIRLSNEPTEKGPEALALKIFEVDREGLPDLKETELENPLGKLSEFLEDKHILFQVESMDYVGKNDSTLHIEREDGRVVEVEFVSKRGRLACSGKTELSCHCFEPKVPVAVDDEDLPDDHPDKIRPYQESDPMDSSDLEPQPDSTDSQEKSENPIQ